MSSGDNIKRDNEGRAKTAARKEATIRRYALKFRLNDPTPDPTQADIRRTLQSCITPPKPSQLPLILAALHDYDAETPPSSYHNTLDDHFQAGIYRYIPGRPASPDRGFPPLSATRIA